MGNNNNNKRRKFYGNNAGAAGNNGAAGNGGSGGASNGGKTAQQNGQNGQRQQNKPQNAAGGGNGAGKNKPKNRGMNSANNANKNRNANGNNGGKNRADDGRKDTYVYELDGNVYINLTNKCSNGCEFCVRNERASYYGNYLWIRHGDPTAEKVIAELEKKDVSAYKELVFCGFGEPTYKMGEMTAVAEYAHSRGLKTRLNTNGQGNLINKRDIVPELKGKIDLVNVSLNAPDAESYQKICHSQYRLDAFPALVEFAKSCVKNGVACRFSVVDCIGAEAVESCRRLAESEGVPLYVRKYIADS